MASTAFKESFEATKARVIKRRQEKVTLHRSFKRSHREDYERELKVPGLFEHAFGTLKFLFGHWQLFGGLLIVAMFLITLLVGVMSETSYARFQDLLDSSASGDLGGFAKSGLILLSAVSTGGFLTSFSQTQAIFTIFVFLIVWLITIYLIRHLLAGHTPKLKDGCFNALAPLLSTCVVAITALLSLIPFGILIVISSAAVSTGLLSTPFYAFIFLIFAALMSLLSLYLFSSSLLALIAVSAPGVYPLVAIHTANDLIAGRRIRFYLRIIFVALIVAVGWAVIMVPLIFLDMLLKQNLTWLAGFPFIPICLLAMTCATFIYISAYFYLFYRRMLEND